VLVVSESLDDVDRSVHRLLALLLVAGPVVLVAAAAGGWWLAREALRPVRRMTEEAAGIGVDRLDERVAVPRTGDEIERLGATLNAMLERLERGVAEQRRFVADAAHELRTPLAVMRSEIEVSLRSDDLPPAAAAVLESTGEEVGRMAAIVENLLTLARIDEGRLELLRGPVDLADVARGVARRFQATARSKGIGLLVSGEGASVLGDRERLHQAVANLVDNAVKYTGAGGRVRVTGWRRDGEAGLTVSDTGPGIPAEVLPRIFDRFVRADPARTRRDGSGLGLAICKEIIEAHGGRVWAESEPGRGSSFSIALRAS
jgi:heavy metal sensor kinase